MKKKGLVKNQQGFLLTVPFQKVNEKNAEWLKNNGLLNDDVPVEKADVSESINLKKTIGVSITAKNIVKKYRNLARKKPYEKRPSKVVVKDSNDI